MLHIEIRLSYRGCFVAYAVDDYDNTWAGYEAGQTDKISEAVKGLKKLVATKLPDMQLV